MSIERSLLPVVGVWLLGASACADGAGGPAPDRWEGSASGAAGAASSSSLGSAGEADSHAGHHGDHEAGAEGGAGDGGSSGGSGGRGGEPHGHGGTDGSGDASGGSGATAGHAGSHDGHAATGGFGDGSGDEGDGGDPGSSAGGSPHDGHGAGGTGAEGGAGNASGAGSASGAGTGGGAGTGSGATSGGGAGGTNPHDGHGATSGTANTSGTGGAAGAGAGASSGGGGQGGAAGGAGGAAGSAGAPHEHDHCVDGELPDPRDALLATPSAPDIFVASNGDIDLPLPEPVLDWMDERIWKPSHDGWHNIRRCERGGAPGGEGSSSGTAAMCAHTELIPEHQECEDAENGYEFLVMHRHMLIALRQAFPNHADLFDGFPHFPFEAQDVPEVWRDRFGSGWTQNIVNTARTLEAIEENLDRFPTEGDLGKYIQCGMAGVTSIHGAMHFKWVVNESPNSLGKQSVNLGNYLFWKLHGWIDGIWERYRVAKGLAPDEPKLLATLTAQCREMHALAAVIAPGEPEPEPLPEESGYFHENVRPAFERLCSACHDEASPPAGMSLGGAISSADIVANLVNVPSARGGQFLRVVPGHPEQSWLYLKASGLAAGAACEGEACNTQSMPPGATPDRMLDAGELAKLEQWILDGAPAPTER